MTELTNSAGEVMNSMKRNALVILFGITILLVPVWSAVYWFFDLKLAALIPVIYSTSALVSLIFYLATGPKNFRIFLITCLTLYFILPPTLQVILGGYQNGSGVVFWMFPVVLAACYSTREPDGDQSGREDKDQDSRSNNLNSILK